MPIKPLGDIVSCDFCPERYCRVGHVPHIFKNHAGLSRELAEAKWYIDAFEVCCPKCYAKKEIPS